MVFQQSNDARCGWRLCSTVRYKLTMWLTTKTQSDPNKLGQVMGQANSCEKAQVGLNVSQNPCVADSFWQSGVAGRPSACDSRSVRLGVYWVS